jgi:hypothetical protein
MIPVADHDPGSKVHAPHDLGRGAWKPYSSSTAGVTLLDYLDQRSGYSKLFVRTAMHI